MLTVTLIATPTDLDYAFAIRREVFVVEQNVSAEDEYDEFEPSSRHFLARLEAEPVGTARWRTTDKGIKLERFAVRAAARGQGVGKALVRTVLDDVFAHHPQLTQSIYMHAQLSAMPLYLGFGFGAVGEQFAECGIQHYTMVLPRIAYPHQ